MNIIYTFVVVITMQPIKRHEQLIKYSHEHHHTLALCLRILRQPAANHQADIEQYHGDLLAHFSSEEQEFAPYWVDINQPALQQRFEREHAHLRALLASPQYTQAEWNTEFATTLREHTRFEERELFKAIEPLLINNN